ncbi:MAG: NAD-dependent epimerase/dehydratase family protein, partial [Rhodospirillales bacterium]
SKKTIGCFAKRAQSLTSILITGAAGRIGRHVACAFRKEYPEARIVGLVYAPHGKTEEDGYLRLKGANVEIVAADILSPESLSWLTKERFDLVIHLAATTDTLKRDHRCNNVGTVNLISALGALDGATHFIFVSSLAVLDRRVNRHEPAQNSSEQLRRPRTGYGHSKLDAEGFLARQCAQGGFRLSILRLCTVFGGAQRPGGMFDMASALTARQSIVARLNWPGCFGLMHVVDVAQFFVRAAARPPEAGSFENYSLTAESLSFDQLCRHYSPTAGVARRRSIHLPGYVWRMVSIVTQLGLCLSPPLLPASLYGRIWQMSLLMGHEVDGDAESTRRMMGDTKLLKFKGSLGMMSPQKKKTTAIINLI